jgi:hypothetical protein
MDLQAANPKDQYMLLRALNEVITSLDSHRLPANYQSQVGTSPHAAQGRHWTSEPLKDFRVL